MSEKKSSPNFGEARARFNAHTMSAYWYFAQVSISPQAAFRFSLSSGKQIFASTTQYTHSGSSSSRPVSPLLIPNRFMAARPAQEK
jgi:hypothetical protein